MAIAKHIRQMIRRLVFGDTLLPQEFTIGLADPYGEISVWLLGLDTPIDITCRHSTACAAPLTLCIALEEGEEQVKRGGQNLGCSSANQREVSEYLVKSASNLWMFFRQTVYDFFCSRLADRETIACPGCGNGDTIYFMRIQSGSREIAPELRCRSSKSARLW